MKTKLLFLASWFVCTYGLLDFIMWNRFSYFIASLSLLGMFGLDYNVNIENMPLHSFDPIYNLEATATKDCRPHVLVRRFPRPIWMPM